MAGSAATEIHVGLWLPAAGVSGPADAEAVARREADARAWRVVQVYRPGTRAAEPETRGPEMRRLLADAREHRIGAVMTTSLDALAASAAELVELEAVLHAHDVVLVSIAERIDTGQTAGRAFLRAAFAAARLRQRGLGVLSEPDHPAEPRPSPASAPFGYRWRRATLEAHPFEAPVRALVHELFAECGDARKVARLLNERGYRLRGGGRFSETRIVALLRDPVAIGLYRGNNYIRRRGGDARRTPMVELRVDPVITTDTWDRCVRLLDHRQRSRGS